MRNDYSVLNQRFTDLNPVCYGSEACLSGHSYGYAVREYFLLHFILSGNGYFIRGEQTHHLGPDALFLIRPGESTFYQADRTHPWEYVWIGFDGGQCAELLEQTVFARDSAIAEAPQTRHLFEELRRVPDRVSSTELLLCARLYELLALLQLRSSAPQSRPEDYVRRAADYIRSNYPMPVTIEGIADMLHLNRRYLSRIFLERTGRTPQEYLTHCRLTRATELLKSGCSVAETAHSVGYENASHFSKAFKQQFGIPPSAFR